MPDKFVMAPTSGEKGKAKELEGEASGSKPVKRRGKGRGRRSVIYGFAPDDRWSIKEKERLLSALKTFAATSIHSLSRYVGTKTPEEVEAKIASIRQFPAQNNIMPRLKDISDDSNTRKAPLELWIPIVRDLIGQEPKDFSQNLSEVLGVIGRTEAPRDSFSTKLNWRNIYQYISDLLADRIHLQSLTSLESLVILDVMHNMADTLRKSDTEEQGRLLNLKYKYLTSDPLCCPEFTTRDEMVAMALSNDFSSVENEAMTASSVATPSSVLSSSSLDVGSDDESIGVAISSAFRSAAQSNVSGSSSSTTPKESSTALESSAPSSSTTSELTGASSVAKNSNESTKVHVNREKTMPVKVKVNNDPVTSKLSPSNTAWTPESGYCRPRYYTMNPLCIPQDILDFKMKKT